MCVIVWKPKKVSISKTTLRDMWDSNNHGAGFSYTEGDTLIIRKGIMTYQELLASMKEHKLQEKEAVLHFRIATHGSMSASMTHPFLVSTDALDYEKSDFIKTKKPVLFHNGIISGFGTKATISDTCEFSMSVLAKLSDDASRIKLLECVAGSKFAYVLPESVYLVGKFEKYQGLQVSNTFFQGRWNRSYYDKTKTGKGVYRVYDYEGEEDLYSYYEKMEEESKTFPSQPSKGFDYSTPYAEKAYAVASILGDDNLSNVRAEEMVSKAKEAIKDFGLSIEEVESELMKYGHKKEALINVSDISLWYQLIIESGWEIGEGSWKNTESDITI